MLIQFRVLYMNNIKCIGEIIITHFEFNFTSMHVVEKLEEQQVLYLEITRSSVCNIRLKLQGDAIVFVTEASRTDGMYCFSPVWFPMHPSTRMNASLCTALHRFPSPRDPHVRRIYLI